MNKELKIGLLAIIAIMVLVFGINYLKGINILNNNRNFYAVYENIGGLQVGGSVMVNGYKVGMVSDIALLIENNQNLLITINIEHKTTTNTNHKIHHNQRMHDLKLDQNQTTKTNAKTNTINKNQTNKTSNKINANQIITN